MFFFSLTQNMYTYTSRFTFPRRRRRSGASLYDIYQLWRTIIYLCMSKTFVRHMFFFSGVYIYICVIYEHMLKTFVRHIHVFFLLLSLKIFMYVYFLHFYWRTIIYVENLCQTDMFFSLSLSQIMYVYFLHFQEEEEEEEANN